MHGLKVHGPTVNNAFIKLNLQRYTKGINLKVKQTSSALTFLMAQYRAIFKRAYIKGLASAVLLTAGLAVGQAQATGLTDANVATDNKLATTGDEFGTVPISIMLNTKH